MLFCFFQEQAARQNLTMADAVIESSDDDEDIFCATPQKEIPLRQILSSDTSKATFSNDTSKATFGNDTSKATFSNNTSNATFSSGSTKTTFSNGSSKPTFSDGSTKPALSTLTSTQTPLREQNSISSYFVGSSQRSEVDDNDEFDVDSCVVVSTGLNRTKRAEMSKFLKQFGISTSNVLDENVTHVVVDVMRENCAVRTLKYIQVRIFCFFFFCICEVVFNC